MKLSAERVLRAAGEAPASLDHRHARASVRQRDGARGPNGETADLEIVVATDGLARDGGIVPTEAWELDDFRSNPVVLLAHNQHDLPIGLAEWTVPDRRRGELRAGWRFHMETPESRTAAKLYDQGFLHAASVGFRLLEHRELDPQEQEDFQEQLNTPEPPRWIAKRAELLEQSAVAVPSDPDAVLPLDRALTDARRAGLDVSPLRRQLRELRRACRAGDEAACRRLDGRAVEVHGLSVRVHREPSGERVLELPMGDGGERIGVPLEPGEDPEDALAALLEAGAREALRGRNRRELHEARAGLRGPW